MQTPKRKPNPYDLIPPDYYITQQELDRLVQEVEKMEKIKRPRIIEEMQAAAEHGDFSENFPYQNAKRRLRGLNYKIDEFKRKINNAIIIEKDHSGIVQVGSTVTFEMNGNERTYTILGAQEANPDKNIISHQTPLGEALLGKKEGEEFATEINERKMNIKIIKVA